MKLIVYIFISFVSFCTISCGNRTNAVNNSEDSLIEIPLEDTTAIDSNSHLNTVDSLQQTNDSIAKTDIQSVSNQIDMNVPTTNKKHKKRKKKTIENVDMVKSNTHHANENNNVQ